jgi:hypothetical protein
MRSAWHVRVPQELRGFEVAASQMKLIAIAIADNGFDRGMVFEVFYPLSIPAPPLSTGDELVVLLTDRSEVLLEVMAVNESQAIVRISNLGEWRIEELQVAETPKRLTDGDRTTYWQVGDRVSNYVAR